MTAQATSTGSSRPTAASATRRRRFARWRPRTALAVVVLGLIGSQLLALGFALAVGGDRGLDWVAAAGILIADAFLLAVVIAFARRGADKLGPATFGIRRTKFWPALGWMLMTYFAVMVFNVIWLLVIGTGSAPSEQGGGTSTPSIVAGVLIVFGIVIAAPIVEEIVFRGYLFPALARWRGPWIGAVVGGAIFGLAHCLVYPPQLLPLMAVFGFAACMLFWFTGSLLPCIALHAMNNALVTGTELGWSGGVPLLMLGSMALSLLLLAPFARERAPQTA